MTDLAEQRAWSPQPFLNHLNQRHPDTVLFLARHLADEAGVAAAALVDVDGDRLTVRVDTADGRRTMTVPLPRPVQSRADLLPQLLEMLRMARTGTPTVPLTSLESVIEARPSGAHRP
jgi:hypothetical protein